MLNSIFFNDEKCFDFAEDNNYIDILTENAIILCTDTGVKHFLYKEICDICNGKHKNDGHLYYTKGDDHLALREGINYLPTTELFIDDEQKIILTVEAPYILTAKSPEDIWFAARTSANKISLYPLKIFKGYREKWNQGVEAVYYYVVEGRYGTCTYGNIVDTKIGVE